MAFEGVNKTVEVNNEIIPKAFFDEGTRILDKECLLLELVRSGGEVDAALRLNKEGDTLLRSLTASSIFQDMPGKKKIWKLRNCWIRYKSFRSSRGKLILALGLLNSKTYAEWGQCYF